MKVINIKNYDNNNTDDSNCDAGKDVNNANTIHTHQLTAKAIIMMSAPYNCPILTIFS